MTTLDYYDEALEADGSPRPEYAELLDVLAGAKPAELSSRVEAAMERMGTTFGQRGAAFPVCPIPRLIPKREWVLLERGLAQRARALNAFIADVYADRDIVRAGVVPPHVIAGADHFEPAMVGLVHAAGPAPIIGFDLVRGSDGALRVLEDNLRTPSGLAYSAAVRRAVTRQFPATARRHKPLDPSFEPMRMVLEEAAGETGNPAIALLTDGPSNSAYWEHRTLARRLAVSLVTPERLRLSEGRVCVVLPSGKLRALDVIYRRTDEDSLRDADGRPTWLAEMLLEPLQRGTIALVNAPGTGVADDKLAHAYVEEMIRFYLDEEPLLESVRTFDLTRPDICTKVLGRLSGLVIKPRTGQGGEGVFIGPLASPEEAGEGRRGRAGGAAELRGAGDGQAVAAAHGRRRPCRAAAHRPARVLDRRGPARVGVAGCTDPSRAAARVHDREQLAGRRRKGHLDHRRRPARYAIAPSAATGATTRTSSPGVTSVVVCHWPRLPSTSRPLRPRRSAVTR